MRRVSADPFAHKQPGIEAFTNKLMAPSPQSVPVDRRVAPRAVPDRPGGGRSCNVSHMHERQMWWQDKLPDNWCFDAHHRSGAALQKAWGRSEATPQSVITRFIRVISVCQQILRTSRGMTLS